MTGPSAAVRIHLTARERDDLGWCTREGEDRVYGLLAGIPAQARVTLDLGSVRHCGERLVWIVATSGALNLIVEAEDWRASRDLVAALQSRRNSEVA